MKVDEIKKLMARAGVTQAMIARRVGVSREFVRQVISGIRSTPKVRMAIAEALGRSVEELWGEEDSKVNSVNDEDENSHEMSERVDIIQKKPERNDEVLEDGEKDSEAIMVPIFCYYKFNKDQINKSMMTFYKEVKSDVGKLIGVIKEGRRKRYFMKVEDPREIERVIFSQKCLDLYRSKLITITIKIPEDLLLASKGISSPDSFQYRGFFNFLSEKNKSFLSFELYFKKVNCVRKKLSLLEADYQRLLQIAENNRLSIGKVIEIALRNFMAYNYRENPEEKRVGPVEFNN